MSVEILHDNDSFQAGYINIGNTSFPGIGKLPKRGSIIGIAFNSEKHLDAAIKFLTKAKKELYGKGVKK